MKILPLLAWVFTWFWYFRDVPAERTATAVTARLASFAVTSARDLPPAGGDVIIITVKSQASERGPLFKHAGVERMHPSGLVLGNSRAEVGFDPESPAWPAWARPAFNLALPGAGISAVAGDFSRALHGVTPKLVVVGLDFVDFRVDPTSDDTFQAPAASTDPLSEMRERASALLTMNALVDSVATVKAQHDPRARLSARDTQRIVSGHPLCARRRAHFRMDALRR